MTLFHHHSASTVTVVALSPRLGQSHLACQSITEALADLGAVPAFRSVIDQPLVPAGLDDVDGFVCPPHVTDLVDRLEASDAVVLGVPIHRAAVAGSARNWVELLRKGLDGKPVLPVVAAGSARAHLAAVAFQADLALNFGADALAPVVVTPDVGFENMAERLASAAETLLARVTRYGTTAALS